MSENKSVQFMIGEIHAIVKSHDELLRVMAEKNSSLEKTVALLARVSSDNSGIIKDIQDRIGKEIETNKEISREINELKKNQITLPVLENILHKSNETIETKIETKYAVKLVQTIVFTGMGIIATAIIYGVSAKVVEMVKNAL